MKKPTQTRESIVQDEIGEELYGIYEMDINEMTKETLKEKGHAMSNIKDAIQDGHYHRKDKNSLTHTMERAAELTRAQSSDKIWTMTREAWINFISDEDNTQEAIRNNEIANELLNKLIHKDTKANDRRKQAQAIAPNDAQLQIMYIRNTKQTGDSSREFYNLCQQMTQIKIADYIDHPTRFRTDMNALWSKIEGTKEPDGSNRKVTESGKYSEIMTKVFQFDKTKNGKEIGISKEIKRKEAVDSTTVFGIIENEIEDFKMKQSNDDDGGQVQRHQGRNNQYGKGDWNQSWWKGSGSKGRHRNSKGGKGRRGCFEMARYGKCQYGDDCKYSHKEEDLQRTRQFMEQEQQNKGKGIKAKGKGKGWDQSHSYHNEQGVQDGNGNEWNRNGKWKRRLE